MRMRSETRTPARPGVTFLEGPAWAEQQKRLKDAMAPLRSRGVKVLPYTLEKQWA